MTATEELNAKIELEKQIEKERNEKEKELKGFLKQKRLNYYKFHQDYQGLIYEN